MRRVSKYRDFQSRDDDRKRREPRRDSSAEERERKRRRRDSSEDGDRRKRGGADKEIKEVCGITVIHCFFLRYGTRGREARFRNRLDKFSAQEPASSGEERRKQRRRGSDSPYVDSDLDEETRARMAKSSVSVVKK